MNNIRFMMFWATVWCLIGITNAAQTKKCWEGKYLHQDDDISFCIECPHGTFMPWTNHTSDKCFDCTEVEDPAVEILIRPCDRFHDADVQCVEGFFRRLPRNPRDKPTCLTCRPACPQHDYQVHSCQNFSDLGCCPGENYDYVISEDGVRMCRERPWMCRRGQYLVINLNDCKPCPENTFMPEDYHSHTKCWDCPYLSDAHLPLHAVITQPCTGTQSPRYGCKKGFYVNHELSYRGDDIGCSPCQTCDERKYIGRQCDMYHNTVCCDKPNMTVVDGTQGAQCVENIDCKDGTFNPPACDKTCSQHCRVSETSDVSLCDNNNGTCLFGCLDGYTGDRCEVRLDKKEIDDESGADASTIVLAIILVVFLIVVATCVMYNKCCPGSGSKCGQTLVRCIFAQPLMGADEETGQTRHSIEENERLVQSSERSLLIALVGKTGNGKSTTGNTILDKDKFICCDSMGSVTTSIKYGMTKFKDTAFKVVDIPGVGGGCDEIRKLKNDLNSLLNDNPQHIVTVTLVIRYGGRFTEDDTAMLEMLRKKFGKDFIKHHVIVIMTFGDMFKKNKREETQTFEEWCNQQEGPFANLIKECEHRVMLFDNTLKEGREKYIGRLWEVTKNMQAPENIAQKLTQTMTKQLFCWK